MDRDQLLDKVRENRANHESAYQEASRIYRQEAAQWYRGEAERIEQDSDLAPRKHCPLPVPQSYVSHYDRAIRMLEWSIDSAVPVDEQTFAQLVLDDWDWSGEWRRTMSNYGTR